MLADRIRMSTFKEISKGDDPLGSIGSQELILGDMMAGYFGTVTGIVTNTQLSHLMGLAYSGTLLDSENSDIIFHKFAHKGRILLVPNRPIRHTISWDIIQLRDGVKGKGIIIDGQIYLCRLMTGSRHYYTNSPSVAGGEWEDLFVKFHVSNGGVLTDEDIYILGDGNYSWCQEVCSNYLDWRILRGAGSVGYFTRGPSSTIHKTRGWRPVLEVL